MWFKSHEKHKKSKLKRDIQKLLLIALLITLGIRYPAKVISQHLSKPKINEVNLYSNKSFITEDELLTVRFSNDNDSTLEEKGSTTD